MKKILLSITMVVAAFASQAQSSIAVGATCPNFTLTDSKGVQHKLYDYCNQGKVVIVDFFAYWCGPCQAIAPTVDQLYKKYGCNSGNLIVLGNESDPNGTLANLQSFDAAANLPVDSYPAGFGKAGTNSANANAYGVSAYPTIIAIGPDKKMINNDIWPFTVAIVEALVPSNVTITPKACAPTAVANVVSTVNHSYLTPNPAQNYTDLNVELNKQTNISYQVVDMMGKVIYTSTNNSTKVGSQQIRIQTNTFAKGIYLVKVMADNLTQATLKLKVN